MTNQQLIQLFNAIPQPCLVFEVRPYGYFVSVVNKAFCSRFNCKSNQTERKNLVDLALAIPAFTFDFYQELKNVFDKLVVLKREENVKWNTAQLSEAFGNSNILVEATVDPLINERGKIDHLVLKLEFCAGEIDNLKIENEKLKQTLNLIEEKTKTGRWELDLTTNEMHWSDELYRICGLPPQLVTATPELAILQTHPDDIETGLKDWQNAIDNGVSYKSEMRLVKSDGDIIHVNSYGVVLKDDNGKPKILFGLLQDVTEAKKLSLELQRSIKDLSEKNELFTTIINNIPIGLALNDYSNNKSLYTVLNNQFSDIYGWEMGKHNGADSFIRELFPDENYRNELEKKIETDLAAGKGNSSHWNNLQITTATGQKKIINAARVHLPNQPFAVSTVIDVTDLANKTRELEESNTRYHYVTKATSDAIWDWDLLTNKIYWGDGYEALFGYKTSGYDDDNFDFNRKVHPDDADATISSLRQKIAGTDNDWTHEYRFLKANNEYAHILDKGLIIRDESGKAVRVVGAMQDVSKQKKEQQHLRLLESVIKNTNDAIVISGTEHLGLQDPGILFCNDAFTKITGYTQEEILGKSTRILLGAGTDTITTEQVNNALKNWQPIEVTLLNYKKNGEQFWNNMSIAPIASEEGSITHWISIQRDVTESVLAQQKILRQNNLYAFTNRLNHFILQANDERAIFKEACAAAVETGKFIIAMVGMFESDNHVNIVEYAGLKNEDIINATELFEQTDGPVFELRHDGRHKIFNDIPALPPEITCKLFIAGYPLGSCIKMPIFMSGKVVGVFNLYAGGKNFFCEDDVVILNRATADISTTLEFIEKEKQRTEAQNKLKRTTENLKLSQEIAHIGNWEFDMASQMYELSDEACKIHGIDPANNRMSFAEWKTYLHPDDREALMYAINDTRLTNNLQVIHRIIRKDGEVRHIFVNTRYKYNEEGKAIGVYGITHDVTRFKEVENSLLENQKSLSDLLSLNQNLIASAPIGIASYNGVTGKCVSSNVAYAKAVGGTVEEMLNQNFRHIGSWKNSDILKNAENTLATGEITSDQIFITTTFRKKVWMDYKLLRFYNNNIPHFLILAQEITDQKNTELALQQTQEKYRQIVETTQEGILLLDADDHISFANKRFCEMMEYGFYELIGKSVYGFKEQELMQQTRQLPDRRRTGKSDKLISHYITKTGKKIIVDIAATPIISDDGVYNGVLAMISDITEKRKLEDLFEKTSRLARSGSWEVNLPENSVYCSEVTREIFGKTAEQIITFEGLISSCKEGESRKKINEIAKAAIENGQSCDEELLIVTDSGIEKWIRLIGEVETINNKPVKLFGSVQDIDTRKKAQLEVLETLKEKDQILESVGDAFFAVDRNFTVTYWNKQAEAMLYTPKESIIGKNLWDLFRDAKNNISYTKYQEVLEKRISLEFEDYYQPFGKWFQISAYPGKCGLSAFVKDITDRKNAEQQLRNERNMLRTLIDNVPDAIYYKDLQGRKLISNKVDYELLGAVKEADVIGKTDIETLPGVMGKYGLDEDFNILTTGVPLFDCELKLIDGQNKERWLLTTKLPLGDDNGSIIGLLGIGRDITIRKNTMEKLKLLNAELEQSLNQLQFTNRELEQFAYVASHDLQEPLRMITSFLALIERKYNPLIDEKGRQYIHFAVDGAKRMRQIILDLLEYSRTGRIEKKIELVDVNKVLEDVIQVHKKTLNTTHAEVNVSLLPVIKSNVIPLTQIFQNLIGNSLKYHKKNVAPIIEIKCAENEELWTFSVKDNGIGIASEYFTKIFIIFQRLHRKEEYSGTGIGLAITKKLVENLGGKIWVESEPQNGSTFYFTIPKIQ